MTNAPKPTVVSTPDKAFENKAVEHKIQALATFIATHLPLHDVSTEITLVARSAESPICQALLRHSQAIAERGVRVRALFAVVPTQGDARAWIVTDGAIAFEREIRWARNPRYFDAHEQLVLTSSASWVGDCMRRDPAKRDALDLPKPSCTGSAMFAATSFDRLWRQGVPVALGDDSGRSDALVQELATAHSLAHEAASAEADQNQ